MAAYIDQHEFHGAAASFLQESLLTDQVAIPDVVWSRFIRVVTHPAVTSPPVTWPQVRDFVMAVCRHPNYRADVRGLTASFDTFLILCQSVGARGNLVSDAYIAAVAIDHNASVATWDADFDRLPVSVVRPLRGVG